MSDTVTVACRIRNGLSIGGIVVRGYYHAHGESAPENSFNGYALTENFPKNLWDEWFNLNQGELVVTGRFILAAESPDAVKAKLGVVPKRTTIPFRAEPYRG